MDLDKLLRLSIEREMGSVVGCYLDILNGIEDLVSEDLINKFQEQLPKKRITFLEEEKTYGKSGWEDRYEDKWNVNLYLDIDAIKHGVRSA